MDDVTKNILGDLADLAEKAFEFADARQREAMAIKGLATAILDGLSKAKATPGFESAFTAFASPVAPAAPAAPAAPVAAPTAPVAAPAAPVAAPAAIDDAALKKLVVDCYAAGKGEVVQAFLAFAGKARVSELDEAGRAQLAAEIRAKGVA